MLTGLLAGAARWVTFDALKAVFLGAVITVGLGMAITAYRDFKTGLVAGERLQCVTAIAEGNVEAAKQIDALNAKGLRAATAERDKARAELAQSGEKIVELEQSLHALSDDPVCYPQSIARSLRK